MKPTLLIASDHAGYSLKESLKKELQAQGYTVQDLGPTNTERVDYPDFANKLCEALLKDKNKKGILICGSGIGMSISANRHKGIRAALVENPVSARLSREHNDANVLCLGARFLAPEYALEIANTFLTTPFSKDSRHQNRIEKMG